MMNTHAAVRADGTVERLLRYKPGMEIPAGLGLVELAEPVRCWPNPPALEAVLTCSAAGELSWNDPRTDQQQRDDAAAEVARRREALLSQSDWVTIRAAEHGAPVPPEWAEYRQALRDITKQPGYPLDVTWPTTPGRSGGI